MMEAIAIRDASFDQCSDDFTAYLGMTMPKLKIPKDPIEILKSGLIGPALSAFKNQIIVDLGAGATSAGYQLAKLVGAQRYIGIERFHSERLQSSIEKVAGELPYAVVKSDILKYLEGLEPSTVSLVAAGIDSTIIQSESKRDDIAAQIERVLHQDGLFLSIWSDILPKNIPVWGSLKEGRIKKVLFFSRDSNSRLDFAAVKPGIIEFSRFCASDEFASS